MSFVRCYCGNCKAETLHHRCVCIHCGGGVVVRPAPARKRGYNNAAVRRPYTVEFRGELLSLKQIAKRESVAYATLTERFRNGLRGDKLVAKVPPMRARPKARAA